jgi:hypothetical protein
MDGSGWRILGKRSMRILGLCLLFLLDTICWLEWLLGLFTDEIFNWLYKHANRWVSRN